MRKTIVCTILFLSLIAIDLGDDSRFQLVPQDEQASIQNTLIPSLKLMNRDELKQQVRNLKLERPRSLFWKSTPRKLSWDFPIPSPARRTKRIHTQSKKNSRKRKLEGPDSKNAFPFIWKPLKIKNSSISDTIIQPYIEPENAAQGITILPNEIAAQEENKGPTIKAENNLRRKRRVL